MKAVVYGSGNLAWHLCPALYKAGVAFQAVYSRNPNTGKELADLLGTDYRQPNDPVHPSVDTLFLMLPDDVVRKISPSLSNVPQAVVHTSGSVPLDVLECRKRGVLYPLQTFSRELQPDMHNVPFFVETNDIGLRDSLKALASRISPLVYEANSLTRKLLHVSAVFSSNFVNHLYTLSAELLKDDNPGFNALRPLIIETAQKALMDSPKKVQTGPARRNDLSIISEHKLLLQERYPQLLPIYTLLTESIQTMYQNPDNNEL